MCDWGAGDPGFAYERGIPLIRIRNTLNVFAQTYFALAHYPLYAAGSPFRIPERVFMRAGIDGRLHMLHRPGRAVRARRHWEASRSQQSARRLSSAALRNISVTYASRVYPSLSLPLDSPTAVRTSAARVGRRSCWSRGVHILMDGKGRWPGNVYVGRLWHSLKQEEVYQRAHETVARQGRASSTTCATSTRNAPNRGLTTERPTTYSINENRCPKRHNPA